MWRELAGVVQFLQGPGSKVISDLLVNSRQIG